MKVSPAFFPSSRFPHRAAEASVSGAVHRKPMLQTLHPDRAAEAPKSINNSKKPLHRYHPMQGLLLSFEGSAGADRARETG